MKLANLFSLKRWIARIGRPCRQPLRKDALPRRSFRPWLEPLEDRTVPSTAVHLFQAPTGNGAVTFKMTAAEAGYANELGIYKVQDATGKVAGNLPTGGTAAYSQAVLGLTLNTDRFVLFNNGPGKDTPGTPTTIALTPGAYYAFYLVQDDTTANWQSINSDDSFTSPWAAGPDAPHVWFSCAAANPDGQTDHFQVNALANGAFEFKVEDFDYNTTAKNGTVVGQDFDDMIFVVAPPPPSSAPDGTCPVVPKLPQTAANQGQGPAQVSNAVRQKDGTVLLSWDDLDSDGFGFPWGQTRAWTNNLGYTMGSNNGSGMVDTQLPSLLRVDGTTNLLAVVASGTDAERFTFNGTAYVPEYFSQNQLTYNSGSDTYTFVDTTGNQITFNGFGGSFAANARGGFQKFADAAGNLTQVTSRAADGKPTEVQRSQTVGTDTYTESYLHTYVGTGVNTGLLANVTLRRKVNAGSWSTVRQVDYAYYVEANAYGSNGDLKTATIKDGAGATIDTMYYRYYEAGDANGYAHALKYVFNARSYDRMVGAGVTPTSAADSVVDDYADYYFTFDAQGRIASETVQGDGCSVCTGGQGTYTFSYTASANSADYNRWATKTVTTLPDSNQHIVYTNAFGQVMLDIFKESTNEWKTYFEYDGAGRLVLTAAPSAVSGYSEALADLVGKNSATDYTYLNGTGLIYTTTYYADDTGSTETVAGNAKGYIQNEFLQRGEAGTPIKQAEYQYFKRTAGGATVRPVANATVYRNDNGTGAETTSFIYTWYSGTTQIASLTSKLPVVSSAQNGPGTADVYVSLFDTYGRTTWTRDSEGYLTYFAYDPATSAVTKVIEDVNTANTADFGTLPAEFQGLRATYFDNEALAAGTVVRFDPTVNFNWGTGSPDPALDADTFSARWVGKVTPQYSETYTFTTSADDGVRLWVNGTLIVNKWSWGGTYSNTGTIALTAGQTYDIVFEFFEGYSNATAKLEWQSASQAKQVVPANRLSVGGLHLITSYEVDALGRTTKTTLPAGTVTYATYNDPGHEMRIYSGWNATTGTATGPTTVLRDDRARSYSEVLTMTATPSTSGSSPNLKPTGTEAISGVQTLTRTFVSAGGQITSSRAYFNLTGLTYSTAVALGTLNTHYYQTDYGYDARGRANRTLTPNGTVYRTVYDGLGRVVSSWVGTDDIPSTGSWSPTNNSGANMVQTAAYVYDGGGVGDSNLTRLTLYPGGGAADRVTEYAYDWRDRLVAIKSGVEVSESTSLNRPLTYFEYDNLGEIIASELYDGDTLSITTDANSDGVPDKPSTTYRRARTVNNFDDQGRIFRAEVYSVDQSTGALSTNTLKTDFWFDHRGNVIKVGTPGQGVFKYTFDGVGRLSKSYLTDGGGDTTWGWGDADDVYGDRVAEQTETQYDANSNAIFAITKQRFHELQSNTTGELGDATSGVLARVSYVASYYDSADRLTSVVNVGTNGGSAYTRPGSAPSRSDTVLRTDFSYNSAGWLEDVTNPRGLVTRTQYDNLGRTTRVIEGYVDGTPSAGDDRTTEYTYDGNDNLRTVKAVLPSSAYQTTEYVYGVTTGGGSGVNSNDVVSLIKHPDSSTGDPSTSASDQESFTVNALGETKTATDRNGSVHTYSYDVVGRMTADAVTTLGSGVNGAVRRLETAFDTAGRAYLFTSYDAASAGNVVNQVQRAFNGLGQLITEYQSHSGAVNTGTSPKVQYVYSEMSGGANHSRLNSLIYPDGRQLNYIYTGGWDGALNDALSRVYRVQNTAGGVLEGLAYLGVATPVVRFDSGGTQYFYKQAGESNGDAGDQYTGYDRFGRVAEVRWRWNTTEQVRIKYGYDRDGNRLYADNLVNDNFDELYHADGAANGYDTLNRLTEYQRGPLSDANSDGIPDTVTTAARSQVFSLDAQGNWSSVTTDGTTQNRGHNKKNRITSISGLTTPTYDNNGNLTTDETGQTYVWDAWNRLVAVKNSGGTTIASYTIDPLSRRQSETIGGTTRDFYFSAAWQVLEERVSGTTKVQYVWSPVYVDALIERDRDADGNAGNGLEERVFALQDANYNIVALSNVAGSVIERSSYDPYGQRFLWTGAWATRASSSFAFDLGYQGLRHETTTGNIDVRYRWLRPTLGRAISEDPLGFAAGCTNLYVWIGDNPINGLDPLGLAPFDDLGVDPRRLDAVIKNPVVAPAAGIIATYGWPVAAIVGAAGAGFGVGYVANEYVLPRSLLYQFWTAKAGEWIAGQSNALARIPATQAEIDECHFRTWKAHLQNLQTDAIGASYPGEMFGNTGYKTHAHHIVMRKGLGPEGQKAAEQSQQILRKHGIDPLNDRENLIWSPNWGHPDQYAKDVLTALQKADATGKKEKVVEALRDLGRRYNAGEWRPKPIPKPGK